MVDVDIYLRSNQACSRYEQAQNEAQFELGKQESADAHLVSPSGRVCAFMKAHPGVLGDVIGMRSGLQGSPGLTEAAGPGS